MKHYIVYGAGGHARVVADAIRSAGNEVAAFVDDNPSCAQLNGIAVMSTVPVTAPLTPLVVGIGNNTVRRQIAERAQHAFGTVVHPSAVVAADVQLGEGTVLLANAVIQTGVQIGRHVIVNAGVCIDHDAVIEDYAHIYPHSYIGGGSTVKEGITIGPGTMVLRNTIVAADRQGLAHEL